MSPIAPSTDLSERATAACTKLVGRRPLAVGTRVWNVARRNSRGTAGTGDVGYLWGDAWLGDRLLLIWKTVRQILADTGVVLSQVRMPNARQHNSQGDIYLGRDECVRRKATKVSTRVLCALSDTPVSSVASLISKRSVGPFLQCRQVSKFHRGHCPEICGLENIMKDPAM
jgi:hypothetical protein